MGDQAQLSRYFEILQKRDFHTEVEIQNSYDYVTSNFNSINTDNGMYQMNKDTFKYVMNSDSLNADSEEQVFECVKKYMEYNNLKPEEDLEDLLSVVRLPLVSPRYLLDEVEPMANSYPGSRVLFLEAFRYHILPEDRFKIPANRVTPRKRTPRQKIDDDMILMIGSVYESGSGVLEVYSRSRNEWRVYKDYLLNSSNYAVAVIDNRLMLVGGISYQTNATISTVLSIDLKTGIMSIEAPLSEVKFNVAVAVVGIGKSATLYAIGGAGADHTRHTVEKWSPITRKWSLVTPMNVRKYCCAVVVFNNKIYVHGGLFTNTTPDKKMDMYDPVTDTWTSIGEATLVGGHCTAAATKEFIFLFGGYSVAWRNGPIGTIERFHPRTKTWSVITTIAAIGVRTALTVKDKILLLGGHSNNRNVEEFDTVTHQLRPMASCVNGREYATMVVATLEDANTN